MKLGKAKKLKDREHCVRVPILRGNNTAIIFKCIPIQSWDEFDRLVPDPIPQVYKQRPNGEKVHDEHKDVAYRRDLERKASLRIAWTMIKSIEHTEGLEWENVNYKVPDTWPKYIDELREFLTDPEIRLVQEGVIEVNYLSKDMLDKALENFYLGTLEVLNVSESEHTIEANSTPSGEPVSV